MSLTFNRQATEQNCRKCSYEIGIYYAVIFSGILKRFVFFHSFNASIIVDSSVIKSYTIPVQASLAWPTLVEQSIKFPPTHVGNYSMEEIIITNPSDHPLVVQVVPLLNYPQPDGGLDLLSDRLVTKLILFEYFYSSLV